MLSHLQAILAKIRAFVKEMSKGGPAAKGGGAADSAPVKSKVDLDLAQPIRKEVKSKDVQKTKQHAGGKRTFESTEKFYARARDIYNCFTEAKCISAYTQSPAKVSLTPQDSCDTNIATHHF